ncbi:MAG: flagellar hook-basal body complex protein [Pseudolabrys sp.]|nr:flagellar hook-basal body complex protein [Pseudolabrys sp.]MDP2295157.1 flagellar hook-basal body complex protein [Pseudolabrys sp.]
MGIFGALTTAVTGMRAQAFALENISGNIANSQTTGFKRTDTSFQDLIQDNIPSKQLSGNVVASARSTNTVQGDVQSASVPTFMAINGTGFFVVQQADSYADGRPSFSGVENYSRRGDFQLDQSGYLVNGAGYYLMGIPVDPTTGNLAGSVPQMLQFENGFLPAQQTSEINYRANLSSYPKTIDSDPTVPGSELLNPSNFTSNPVNGAPAIAKLIGSGSTLTADAAAALTGSADLSALSASAGSFIINGTSIAIAGGDNAAAVVAAINLETATTNVTASLDGNNNLVLTGTDASTNIAIGGGSTLALLTSLGVSVGTTNATNILTQGAAATGQTLTFTVGANPPLVVTFGAGNVVTLADLNVALAGLVGGTASANPATGDITVTSSTTTDTITVGGTATARNFGIRTSTALPSNNTVVGQDVTSFLSSSIAGGAVTAYDTSGSAVNVQLRWAKVDSSSLGSGHVDKWNLFYQTDANATGGNAAWQNVGIDYTFTANGQLSPAVNAVVLNNVTVNGVTLGDVRMVHSTGGITQYADSNGSVQVNMMQQNGYAAGQLEAVAVNDKGRITGTYSNGRTIDLAEITLATFSGANMLKRLDGGAFVATAESGTATYGASGKIIGSSLEGSNTDIADEFTKLIVTQQAYSANTKVITTTNQMVQDLLNMLR